ncbi:bifunctional diguanylate cyclase/phosphodiesterase [Aurantimonas sp. MSK8Z-1]|uniref:putative bifunctional diguanylate cyclase/phosphodiesterase n=1 Tax=Mangrovibrevibacter kandeliae TaxID=2968473 RepID=UPI0021178A55|nr:bifunctional diguanylate cyclase/phosphodiesterase [Aurantimonas sp. MSK8Z-1]MCW4114798.1 bifunctional diguanylate cyclase/phosphodiesterase [Aurantimonas sp. MSK8Z-1]
MPKLNNRWEVPLLVVTAGLGFAAVQMLFASVQYMNGISRAAQNNVVYEVMTTAPELARLQATVARFFLPDSDVTRDDIALRFAIVQNRMKILRTQESRALRGDNAEASELLDRMKVAVEQAKPRIEALQTPQDAAALIDIFDPLNRQASQLSALTTANAANRIATNERRLTCTFWLLLGEILGLLACGVVLISLLRRERRKANRAASVDSLTGLPNRLAFNRALADAFSKASLPGDLAVLMFDLDMFKHVNDTLGHAAGDRLLVSVAERLKPLLHDGRIFARLSGDEFAIIFHKPDARSVALGIASTIQTAFAQPFDTGGTMVAVSASVGVAVPGPEDRQPEDLMKNADLALYAVKGAQRGDIRLYEPAMKQAYLSRQTLSQDLRNALANDELLLNFQPVVNLADGSTRGFEALLRWKHPQRGFISPAEFIPIAEESGLILPIGRWVLFKACAVAAQWPETISIGVNLSPQQFMDSELVGIVEDALSRHGIRPDRLTLEITETTLIQNDQSVVTTLNVLRKIGIKTALDDFGTGFASLSYLTRFPFDSIKIDQSFVRGSTAQNNNELIIRSICELAGKLGLQVIAEGIETAEQLALTRSAGCEVGQGYFFDKPMDEVQCATRLSLEQLHASRLHGDATTVDTLRA